MRRFCLLILCAAALSAAAACGKKGDLTLPKASAAQVEVAARPAA